MSSMEEVPASDSGMAGAECECFIYRLRFASLFKMRIKRHTGRARRKMRAKDGRSGTMGTGRHSVLETTGRFSMTSSLLIDLECNHDDQDEQLLVELSSRRKDDVSSSRPLIQEMDGDGEISDQVSSIDAVADSVKDLNVNLNQSDEVQIWNDRLDRLLEISIDSDEVRYKKLVSSNVKKLREDNEGSRQSLAKWMNQISNDNFPDTKSKQRLLAATMILLRLIRLDDRDETSIDCYKLFFGCLVKVCQNTSSLRTNLSAECSKLLCILVHRCAIAGCSNFDSSEESQTTLGKVAQKLLWESLSLLREFLLCKQHWNDIKSGEKQQCNKIVINDFLRVIDDNIKQSYTGVTSNHNDVRCLLCMSLAGTETHQSQISSESKRLGGIDVLEFDSRKKIGIEKCVNELVNVSFLHKSADEKCAAAADDLQRCISREFIAWLGFKSDHSLSKLLSQVNNSEGDSLLKQSTESCLRLLSSRSIHCVEISIACLERLWNQSNGLPLDIFYSKDDFSSDSPKSFELLIDMLSMKRDMDSTQMAVCILMKKCIMSKPLLFPRFICRIGLCDATIQVSSQISQECDCDPKLLKTVGNFLIKHLSDERVMKKARKISLFKNVNKPYIIPLLMSIILSGDDNEKSYSASLSVGMILIHSDNTSYYNISQLILESIEKCKHESSCNSLLDTKIKNCLSILRRMLLDSNSVDTLSDVLKSICQLVLENADKNGPLTLFGALCGDGKDIKLIDKHQRQKIIKATVSLIDLCNHHMEYNGCHILESNIFKRLVPLLILRRLPSLYFCTLFNAVDSSNQDICMKLEEIQRNLLLRMKDELPAGIQFTPEERKLSAEIYGRCLPLDFKLPNSCHLIYFECLCLPVFQSMLTTISHPDTQTNFSAVTRQSKLCLYTICHFVSSHAQINNPSETLTETFSFALQILHSDCEEESFVQLQAGCVDFLAICLDRWLYLSSSQSEEVSSANIVEITKDATRKEDNISENLSISDILPLVLSMIESGKIPKVVSRSRLIFGESDTTHLATQDFNQVLSDRTKLYFINAMVLTSKRCDLESQALLLMKTHIFYRLVHWGLSSDHHPLCVAGALQLCFTMITRSKSIVGINDSIRSAHRWSLHVTKAYVNNDDEAVGMMRSMGLKLMLCIVTMAAQNATDLQNLLSLSPGELGETLNILRGAAHMDTNKEVRKLASHIVEAITT